MALLALMLAPALFHSPDLSCVVKNRRIVVALPLPGPPKWDSRRYEFGISPVTRRGVGESVVIVDDEVHMAPYRWNTRRLVIDIGRQRGAQWADGRRYTKPAFPRPGRYRLIFADTLETEWENMASIECEVDVRAADLRRAAGDAPTRLMPAPPSR